ncbi:MAG: energy transducer TonB [Pseudomonadales bacterium]
MMFSRFLQRAALTVWLLACTLLVGCAATQNRPMQLVSGSGPVYPAAAKADGIEGVVVVRYGVSKDGRVIDARVDSAQPTGIFEDAALAAVRSWRYNPALRDGEPVAVDNVVSTLRFELGNGERYRGY